MAHEWERSEWRGAVASMSERERAIDCRHPVINYGCCVDCGERCGDDD